MQITNFEFKAKSLNQDKQEKALSELGPRFIGEDHQTDTYFNVPFGRLKLRQGNIENSLIFYERENTAAAKQSNILLYKHEANETLKEILIKVHGIKVIVDKKRRIYFIDNVKFHFDTVKDLGSYIEVEAIDSTGDIGIETLKQQCRKYSSLFGIEEPDYISESYSDLIMEINSGTDDSRKSTNSV